MSIWVYQEQFEFPEKNIIKAKRCIYCDIQLQGVQKDADRYNVVDREINICPQCGWWTAIETYEQGIGTMYGTYVHQKKDGGYATLKNFDLTNIEQPLSEVRDYLKVKFEKRFTVNRQLFEHTVASVFKNERYVPEVTSYHNDGGIDIILYEASGARIGVQVKCTKNAITVEQIRAFTGALFIGGYTKGIFVTTSRFQSGVYTLTEKPLRDKGMMIELMDAEKLYDVLKIKKTKLYTSQSEWLADVGQLKLQNFDNGPATYAP